MASTDFISGKHARTRIQLNNAPWEIKVKSCHVRELGTEVTDQVNGENRARFQKLTDGYQVTIQCYDDGQSSALLYNWLQNQTNEDANQPQLPLAGGLRFSYLDGSAGGYVLQGCCLGPLDYDMSGRTERNMGTLTFRAQNFQQVATA